MRVAYTLVLLGATLVTPYVALAHTVGASYEAQVGAYKLDIGYDPEKPVAGERLLLDFDILDQAAEDVPFDDVWIRINQGNTTVLATGIARSTLGPTTLLIATPTGSEDLTVSVRFEREGKALAEGSFSLPVTPAASSHTPSLAFPALLAGFVVGGVLVFVLSRIKKKVVQ